MNLVVNARDAMPRGGSVLIETSLVERDRVPVSARAESGPSRYALLAVTDNGSGIPEELKSHLFDPFVTTKRNGTGLGLALVAKVIGDHGGIIEFDSQPRKTVFRVFLPVVPRGIWQDGLQDSIGDERNDTGS